MTEEEFEQVYKKFYPCGTPAVGDRVAYADARWQQVITGILKKPVGEIPTGWGIKFNVVLEMPHTVDSPFAIDHDFLVSAAQWEFVCALRGVRP